MRTKRDEAIRDFQLMDDMPFCPDEYEMEELTSALDNIVIRRVDRNMYNKKQRRLNSTRVIEQKPMDDAIVKALLRFSNTIQDCMASSHQIKVVSNKTSTLKMSRTARETKAKQISLQKVQDETKRRTELRKDKIRRKVLQKMQDAAQREIYARQQVEKDDRKKQQEEKIKYTEEEMLRITQMDEDDYNKKVESQKIARKAHIEQRRKYQKADVQQSLNQLRLAMDQLDCAADAMVNRRFVFN